MCKIYMLDFLQTWAVRSCFLKINCRYLIWCSFANYLRLPASRQLKVAKLHSWKSFKYYYLFSSLAKRKKVSMYYYNLYIVLQKGEMILMKCQVVRHNNNNKSFQISSKIPHYYYPSVAKPLTTLKVICQITYFLYNDVSLASAV